MSETDAAAEEAAIFATEEPIALFHEWMELARAKEPEDPNAMALATADAGGFPDVRMVLLKGADEAGSSSIPISKAPRAWN